MNPQYEVVSGTKLAEFCVMVQDMMQYGWKPCGGVSVVAMPNGSKMYFQAMTKGVTETG